jgi:cytosine/adenosine deaminase-related metal-dependent hydrolase
MHYLSADLIIPIEGEPRYNSVLAIDENGVIEGIYEKDGLEISIPEIVHYNGILCPGFVNTHCHLELSWAKGLITQGKGLDSFIRQFELLRKSVPDNRIQKAITDAGYEMEQLGIVAAADIANGIYTIDFKCNSNIYYHTFVEVFGSDPTFAASLFEKALYMKSHYEAHPFTNAVSIVPHATYSLSEELWKLVAHTGQGSLLSIHHQESADENHFFMNGSGMVAERRKAFNPHLPAYPGTGKRPMESIAGYFNPDQKLLLVHNTVSEQQDIDFVNRYFRQAYWCFCPNANLHIENKLPDLDLFRRNNCRITLGTDSLASNHTLSILDELKTVQLRFPHIPLTEIMRWGTISGAEFLGLDQQLGSFAKGKKPGVVLIENADLQTLRLKPESTSRLIIPAHK